MLLKFTYCAQEQELLSDYCAIHIQFCMKNSLHVEDSFIKTVLLECITECMVFKYTIMLYHTLSVSIVHYNFLQMFNIAININFTISYYAGIRLMLSMAHYAQNYAGI